MYTEIYHSIYEIIILDEEVILKNVSLYEMPYVIRNHVSQVIFNATGKYRE